MPVNAQREFPMPHVCPWWFAYTFDHRLRLYVHNPERILGPYVKPGMTAIDLGCGMGYFSIPLARMVGDSGKVLAVDIQQKMLDVLMKRAQKAGVGERLRPVLCDSANLCVEPQSDFALAFFMIHEAPAPARYIEQVYGSLKPGARFLFVEPKWHVPREQFDQLVAHAQKNGFSLEGRPRIAISHAALLARRN